MSIIGSKPPTASPEYTAPVKSKKNPAYAHSLIRGNPGTSNAIIPSSLATPIAGNM